MAASGGLSSLFENPLPESPRTLFDYLTKPKTPIDAASFTELFGELNFEEKGRNGGFAAKNANSESLQLCTEGLGSESSDDIDEFIELVEDWNGRGTSGSRKRKMARDSRRSRQFPPPISSIGRNGRPSICFRSYRHGGRFVLKEVQIWNQEVLYASREDGRLKLHFVHPGRRIDEQRREEERETEEGDVEEEEESRGTAEGSCRKL
ncbi:hypothetical protein HPP92_009556 [Vanilla planifolia]|uniref:FAF domain-containing protein n=1 Tax=Vanilla planifolia TaxID=51239 RepID=A0A835R810_VANPL|nr:hypothetical protein HPP92_009556 [Vanilla planifolia]